MQDVDSGEAVHAPGEEPSVLLVQFCCEPKTALKNKVLSKKIEYWSGLSFPFPGDLPNPGIDPGLQRCRQILYHLSHQVLNQ